MAGESEPSAGHPGLECRDLRLAAGISLDEMGRRVHRHPSSLSRFENGSRSPRDVEQLVAAYRALAPAPVASTDGSGPLDLSLEPASGNANGTERNPGLLFLALYIIRWVAFGLAVALVPLFTPPYGSFDEDHPRMVEQARSDAWRIFLLVSMVGAAIVWWYHRRGMLMRHPVREGVIATRAVVGPAILCIAINLNRGLDTPAPEVAALIWIETGYWVWAVWARAPDPVRVREVRHRSGRNEYRERLIEIWYGWERAYREPTGGWAGVEEFHAFFEKERDRVGRRALRGRDGTLSEDAEALRKFIAAGGDLRVSIRGVDNMADARRVLLADLDALIDDIRQSEEPAT